MWQPEVQVRQVHRSHLHVLPSPYSTPHSWHVAARGPTETGPPLTLTCASFPLQYPSQLTCGSQRSNWDRSTLHTYTCILPPYSAFHSWYVAARGPTETGPPLTLTPASFPLTVPFTADMWQPEVQLRQVHPSHLHLHPSPLQCLSQLICGSQRSNWDRSTPHTYTCILPPYSAFHSWYVAARGPTETGPPLTLTPASFPLTVPFTADMWQPEVQLRQVHPSHLHLHPSPLQCLSQLICGSQRSNWDRSTPHTYTCSLSPTVPLAADMWQPEIQLRQIHHSHLHVLLPPTVPLTADMWQPEVQLRQIHHSHLHVLLPPTVPLTADMWQPEVQLRQIHHSHLHVLLPPTVPLTADMWQPEVQLRQIHHSHLHVLLPPTVPLTADMWQPEVQLRQIHHSHLHVLPPPYSTPHSRHVAARGPAETGPLLTLTRAPLPLQCPSQPTCDSQRSSWDRPTPHSYTCFLLPAVPLIADKGQPEVQLRQVHSSHLHVFPSPCSTPHSWQGAAGGPAETGPLLTLTCASFPLQYPSQLTCGSRRSSWDRSTPHTYMCFLSPTVPLTADMWQPEVQLRQVHSSCHLRGTFDLGPQKFNFSQFTLRLHLNVWGRYVRFSKTVKIEVSSCFIVNTSFVFHRPFKRYLSMNENVFKITNNQRKCESQSISQ